MVNKILALLKGLEAAFPPPPKCHHAITYNTYGGEDRLGLHLWVDGKSQTFFVFDDDLDVPLEALVNLIRMLQ